MSMRWWDGDRGGGGRGYGGRSSWRSAVGRCCRGLPLYTVVSKLVVVFVAPAGCEIKVGIFIGLD